jgi:hypothetical protein
MELNYIISLKKSSMKIIKKSKPVELNAVVLTIENISQVKILLHQTLGETLISRQIHCLVAAGVQELFFFLPLKDEALRSLLRKEALKHPIKIQEFNLNDKYNLWQNLSSCQHLLPSHFLLAPATTLNLDYFFPQLQLWRGDVILTGNKTIIHSSQGSVKVVGKLVQTVSSQQIQEYLNLTAVKVISQKFLTFSQDKIITKRDWFDVLNQFCDQAVVKVCEFLPSQVELSPQKDDYFYQLAHIFFAKQEKTISEEAQIAPTTRLKGEIVIEAGARVGEFCVLEGPLYLGRGTKVGNFVTLGPSVFAEAGSIIESHSHLHQAAIGENSLVQTTIKTKVTSTN